MRHFLRIIEQVVTPSLKRVLPFQILLLCVLCSGRELFSQTQNVSTSLYYVGEGIDKSQEQARLYALNALMQQIQVFLASSFEHKTSELAKVFRQSTSLTIIARSIMQLRDVQEKLDKQEDGFFHVTKYVTKEAVSRMFAQRRQQVLEHLQIADRELSFCDQNTSCDVGVVLKHYYWAYLLAHLYPDTISFGALRKNYSSVLVGAPDLLESLIKKVSIQAARRIKDQMIVWQCAATVTGSPISHLLYSYFDGMGQTDGEIRDGQTKLTLFFSDEVDRQREVVLEIEYKYADEMDATLRLADSLVAKGAIPNTVTLVIPGSSETKFLSKSPPETVKAVVQLPQPLRDLLADQNSFEETMKTIERLARQGKIIPGSAKDFESLDGLYGVVLDPHGLSGIIRCEKGKYFDALSKDVVDLRKFAGKRITWIEVLH